MHWIAIDWGTSSLRVWRMEGDKVVAEAASKKGMGSLSREEFEPALLELIGDWIDGPTTAIACGMVGARQGWIEAPYAKVPCNASPDGVIKAPVQHPDLTVHIIPGLSQSEPADVMRGEETQIAGFLALNPEWDGVIALPGTHTKWAHISADEVVSFQTYMTGDLFAAITGHTVLRHSVQGDDTDLDAFDAAVAEIISRPERLAQKMFSLRAEGLLNGMGAAAAKGRLSGLLIGAEIAGAKPYWLGQNVALIGAGPLVALYARALAAQGVPVTLTDGAGITLAGLTAAYKRLETAQ